MVRRLSAEPGVFIGTQSGERVEGSSAVWESRGTCAQRSPLGCCRPQGQSMQAAGLLHTAARDAHLEPPRTWSNAPEKVCSGEKCCQVLANTMGGRGRVEGAMDPRSCSCGSDLTYYPFENLQNVTFALWGCRCG